MKFGRWIKVDSWKKGTLDLNRLDIMHSNLVLFQCSLLVLLVHKKHMWIPLLNNYRSYRQISIIGDIDCPSPKQFYSSLTQNWFRILERILSNNWCLDATCSNKPQVSSMFKKMLFWKPINQTQSFNCGPKGPRCLTKKLIDIENSLGYPNPLSEFRPRPRNGCFSFF